MHYRSRRGQSSQRAMTTRQSMQSRTTSSARNANAYQGDDMVIPIIEEEIRVGKRDVEGRGVRVSTRVEEVPVNEQVTLRDEDVHVERRRVDQTIDPAAVDALFQEGMIEVHEHDEQAIVSKEAHIVEEVVINKDRQERSETIQDTVQRTAVDVEQIQGETRTSATQTVGRVASWGKTGPDTTTTGTDLDQDGDVGRRDPRTNS